MTVAPFTTNAHARVAELLPVSREVNVRSSLGGGGVYPGNSYELLVVYSGSTCRDIPQFKWHEIVLNVNMLKRSGLYIYI